VKKSLGHFILNTFVLLTNMLSAQTGVTTNAHHSFVNRDKPKEILDEICYYPAMIFGRISRNSAGKQVLYKKEPPKIIG
jgi:hypothetical protein